jgi:3-hydroxyacyl-CoA dehydrogenase / enoyl-CoA hydratase / 3-hydroxybutyryl-CoA epimerase
MVERGDATPADIDTGMTLGCAYPMGPFTLLDYVGLDTTLFILEGWAQAEPGNPLFQPPKLLRDKVKAGKLGRKTGEGFYVWKDGKPQKAGVPADVPEHLQERLVRPMLDACEECLREGVVESAEIVDAAMIFGTGFAPFRGGPMHHLSRSRSEDIAGNAGGSA